MTIFHPRVGFEIYSLNAGGTSDPADAVAVTIDVGKTLITALPAVGWTAGSGLAPGGIKINDTDAGNEIMIRAGSNGSNVRIYLPTGTNFLIATHTPSEGDIVNILKLDDGTWSVTP